jgi:hypothetical protein
MIILCRVHEFPCGKMNILKKIFTIRYDTLSKPPSVGRGVSLDNVNLTFCVAT